MPYIRPAPLLSTYGHCQVKDISHSKSARSPQPSIHSRLFTQVDKNLVLKTEDLWFRHTPFSNPFYRETSQTFAFLQWVCKQKGKARSLNHARHQCIPSVSCNSTWSNMGIWSFLHYFCILTFSFLLFPICTFCALKKNHIRSFFLERNFSLLTYLLKHQSKRGFGVHVQYDQQIQKEDHSNMILLSRSFRPSQEH